MSIYTFYPKVSYKIDEYDSLRAIDITSALKIKDYLKGYRGIGFPPYIVRDGERPDYVSYVLYGNPDYDWVIMLVNDIHSLYDDWPRNSVDLESYIIEKYGSLTAAMTNVKYYYNSNGDIIDLTTYNNLSVTARSSETEYEYELRKNSNKSKIKVVNRSLITTLTSDLNSITMKPVV